MGATADDSDIRSKCVHGVTFWYKRRKEGNVLNRVIRAWSEVPSTTAMVVGRKEAGGVCYAIFPAPSAVDALIAAHGNLGFFEVIPANLPVWPFLDIEYYTRDLGAAAATCDRVLATCVSIFRAHMVESFGQAGGAFDAEDVEVCNGSGLLEDGLTYKCSFHVRVRTPRAFRCCNDLSLVMASLCWKFKCATDPGERALYDSLYSRKRRKDGKEEDDYAIDMCAYKGKQLFKMAHQGKHGSPRIQTPLTSATPSDHFCCLYGAEREEVGAYYDVAPLLARLADLHVPTGFFKIKPRDTHEALLKDYYANAFPAERLCAFLRAYFPDVPLAHREFAFTSVKGAYCRYRRFDRPEELRADAAARGPLVVHGGPTFVLPCERGGEPLGREFVVDVDIKDVGPLRACCGESDMLCGRCWGFVRCNIRALAYVCRRRLGCEMMWCFSGGKGIHGWLLSPDLHALCSPGFRGAVCDALGGVEEAFVRGGKAERVKRGWVDSDLGEALYDLLLPDFLAHIELQQRVFDGDGREAPWLDAIRHSSALPEDEARRVAAAFSRRQTGSWTEFVRGCELLCAPHAHLLRRILVLTYCLPRIDEAVLRQPAHLTKLPFSVHAKSGHVALPLACDAEDGVCDLEDCLVPVEELMLRTDEARRAALHARFNGALQTLDAAERALCPCV